MFQQLEPPASQQRFGNLPPKTTKLRNITAFFDKITGWIGLFFGRVGFAAATLRAPCGRPLRGWLRHASGSSRFVVSSPQ